MSQFLQDDDDEDDDNDNAKAISIPRVFFRNSRAEKYIIPILPKLLIFIHKPLVVENHSTTGEII